jgi:hypothetical protein
MTVKVIGPTTFAGTVQVWAEPVYERFTTVGAGVASATVALIVTEARTTTASKGIPTTTASTARFSRAAGVISAVRCFCAITDFLSHKRSILVISY